MAFTSLALSLAGNVLGAIQQNKQVAAQQEAINKQFQLNLSATRAGLDTLYSRAGTVSQEISRDYVRQTMAAERAGIKAIGKGKVQAATLGTGGRRTDLQIEQEVSREVGNVQTEAAINKQIQEWNLQNAVSDQSAASINALNNSIPAVPGYPSGLQTAVNIGAGFLKTYQSFDQYEQADVQRDIETDYNKIKSFFE